MNIKVLVEDKIPFLMPLLEQMPGVEATVVPTEGFTPAGLGDADAIFVRTRTRCDEALLGRSQVKFVATATIGIDHIDTAWCQARGIAVANAPGCNAPAVAQWVAAAASAMVGGPLQGLTMGVVGVGHVGRIVAHYGRMLGMRVLLVDPPRRLPLSLDEVAPQADILTFHTPLTLTGPHPTHHLFDSRIAAMMRPGAIVMNASRGAVADGAALADAIEAGRLRAAIDTWEGEPLADPRLVALAEIATPHIAGYSLQGKHRAAAMTAAAFAAQFGLELPEAARVPAAAMDIDRARVDASYDILADSAQFKAAPGALERLRDTYPLRQEILTQQ